MQNTLEGERQPVAAAGAMHTALAYINFIGMYIFCYGTRRIIFAVGERHRRHFCRRGMAGAAGLTGIQREKAGSDSTVFAAWPCGWLEEGAPDAVPAGRRAWLLKRPPSRIFGRRDVPAFRRPWAWLTGQQC